MRRELALASEPTPKNYPKQRREKTCEMIVWPREKFGGRDRVRTCDPLLAKQVLSQLSYTPILTEQLVS
jgi:hypothetical protein